MTGRRVIESGVRLSDSVLWSLQRAYFERQGIEPWRANTVPHYVTSHPALARAYAQVVFGWLRDIVRTGAVDPSEPVPVVELGAGSGRFGFHFLHHFFALHDGSVLRDVPVRFVMTDLGAATVEEWRDHPQLRPWIEAGALAVARFDAEREDSLAAIGPDPPANPVAFLANYVFDGLPADAYLVRDGCIHENLVTIDVDVDEDGDAGDPPPPAAVRVRYDLGPRVADPYDDPAWNEVLRSYASLPDTNLLFPVGALRCLANLHRLAGGRYLLVTGDKGYHDDAALEGRPPPRVAGHGSVSMSVNYDAIGRYLAMGPAGGELLTLHRAHHALDVCVGLAGAAHGDGTETRQAFAAAIDEVGPDDFYTVRKAVERHAADATTAELVSLLRLSGWDARIFLRCFPALLDRVGGNGDRADRGDPDLAEVVHRVWDAYFWIGEAADVPFALGALAYGLGRYEDAARLLEQSLRLHGPDPATLRNLASCYELLAGS